MNIFAGILSEAINVDDECPGSPSRLSAQVKIAIEHPYYFRGEVIASSVPLSPLKATAPKLFQYLTIDGAQIVLPRSEAMDQNLLLNLIDLIVEQHRLGEDFDVAINELPRDPVKLISLHVLFELFGLSSQAQALTELLWVVFETHTLTLTDVFWIVGAFYPRKSIEWVPESTDAYVRMMTWNLLNSDAEVRLHAEVRTFFLDEEGRPYLLTRILKKHYGEYGLGRSSQAGPKMRRDTMTERTETVTSLLAPASVSAPAEKPIFPARWMSSPEPEQQPKPVLVGSLFLNEKWDGKDKNVKEMVAERDEIVSLRRKQALFTGK